MTGNLEVEEVFDGKRIELTDINGRKQYFMIDTDGIIVTFPDNERQNWNYQATATALTRMISIIMTGNATMKSVKKQLRESSKQKGDTPDLTLQTIERYEEAMNVNKEIGQGKSD